VARTGLGRIAAAPRCLVAVRPRSGYICGRVLGQNWDSESATTRCCSGWPSWVSTGFGVWLLMMIDPTRSGSESSLYGVFLYLLPVSYAVGWLEKMCGSWCCRVDIDQTTNVQQYGQLLNL
jgi:hypothetical protein